MIEEKTKLLPNGRQLTVLPLTFGRARLHEGPAGEEWFDDGW